MAYSKEKIESWFLNHKHSILRIEKNRIFFECTQCKSETSVHNLSHLIEFEKNIGPYHFSCKKCYREKSEVKRTKKLTEKLKERHLKKELELQKLFESEGSRMISSYKGINNSVSFLCRECGKEETNRSLYQTLKAKMRFYCYTCMSKKRIKNIGVLGIKKYTKEIVEKELLKRGSYLISFENQGRNSFSAICVVCKKNQPSFLPLRSSFKINNISEYGVKHVGTLNYKK